MAGYASMLAFRGCADECTKLRELRRPFREMAEESVGQGIPTFANVPLQRFQFLQFHSEQIGEIPGADLVTETLLR